MSRNPSMPAHQMRQQGATELVESERCQACSGRGVIQHGGYYVPGEQFVEPPSEDLCEDCLATGVRAVQEQSRELEQLREAAHRYLATTEGRAVTFREGLTRAVLVELVTREA